MTARSKTDLKDRSLYLGTMTGTSMDGMDIAAVSFASGQKPEIHATSFTPYPGDLRQALQQLAQATDATVDQLGKLDTSLGQFYAEQISQFITTHKLQDIIAIGSHGQTIRHSTTGETPYTIQIGDPNIIAARCGHTVVADFRRRDLALGGEGAPLAPAFHDQVFRSPQHSRIILNIGGIANITWLPSDEQQHVIGFDTGPGNTLMDYLAREQFDQACDRNGDIAAAGSMDQTLIEKILETEPYFSQPAPKSTGTDYFSPQWLHQSGILELAPADAMSTLAELTIESIARSIEELGINIDECYACGGGAHNRHLMQHLATRLAPCRVSSTEELGVPPDWVEACAFAWLAKRTLERQPGNLPSVTNAEKFTILGAVYY